MEAPALYATAPSGPRDLSVPLAAWLRAQGFTAAEQARPATATVAAHWLGPQGERFQLDYAWVAGPVPSATCWLTVRYPGQLQPETLFTAQHVRRLQEARQLLLGNVRYANARTLAKLVPAPTDY
ncbi:hypothetical protein JAO73_10595 [Hymenobacter sp. BT523]|uniref:hypothetical protein n=1 Tax=Hymenobacter sp. BT523 TaxID=2795725 RepID=UPI0018EB28DD|nr:hypothetical protein [Hymenobacter sp. BT523]MBJ6109464.1 hypothetical protein [Hymenobacter sp. BT523]